MQKIILVIQVKKNKYNRFHSDDNRCYFPLSTGRECYFSLISALRKQQQDSFLPGCDSVQFGRSLPVFQINVLSPYSRQESNWYQTQYIRTSSSILSFPEDGGSTSLHIIGIHLSDHTVSHPRRIFIVTILGTSNLTNSSSMKNYFAYYIDQTAPCAREHTHTSIF